ncbi:MAG: peptidylprolyl isomerase [Prosthecobacter sp.]
MLEFFRRHRGAFLIVLTIVIIITFSVWGGWRFDKTAGVPQALPSDHAMTVYGKDYTNAEVGQVGRSLQFAMQHLSMFDLYIGLSSLGKQDGSNSGGGIVGTALVLKQVLEDNGIRASDAEAVEALKKLPNMQGPNGIFDPSRGQQVEETAGMYGLNTADLLDIMRLKIGLDKIKELVTKNYAASSFAAEKQYASNQQTMKVSTIAFDTEAFKKDIKVTDDEIKKAYDEAKESYMTIEKRAVKYVFFETPKDLDKKPLEERTKLQQAVSDRLNAFTEKALAAGREANLEKLAAELKEKVETIAAFEQATPPEALKTEAALVEAIFSQPKSQPVSDAVKTDKGWYVFTVSAIEEPTQQELAAVKDKVKDGIVEKKAAEARTKAVNEARDFLVAGLKDKKKIEDLVKDKKLTLAPVIELDAATPAPNIPNSSQIAREAQKTGVGQISQAVDTDKGTVLVYVNAKELRKSDNAASLRKQQADSLASKEGDGIFEAWFAKKVEEARIEVPVRTDTAA